MRNQLREFGGITAMEPPAGFVGQLRPYQQEGLGWFEFLRQFSFGGSSAALSAVSNKSIFGS